MTHAQHSRECALVRRESKRGHRAMPVRTFDANVDIGPRVAAPHIHRHTGGTHPMTQRYWGNAHDIDCCARDIRDLVLPMLDGDDENPDIIRAINMLERIAGDLDAAAKAADEMDRTMIHEDDYKALVAEVDDMRERVADFDRGIYTRDELLRLVAA